MIESELANRIRRYAREWAVVVKDTIETETSVIAFGTRKFLLSRKGTVAAYDHDQAVVIKVIKQQGDEWRSGEVLEALNGIGVVCVYEHAPGAVLMERLRPGSSLVNLALNGRDEEATDILASIIRQMSELQRNLDPEPEAGYLKPLIRHLTPETRHLTPGTCHPQSPTDGTSPIAFPSVQDWARGFDRYLASSNNQIPKQLVETAQHLYLKLAATQRQPRLLHGDLQHYNVLFDSDRGWVAIDPKGVIGEVEYEIGAALRNPIERPDLFLSRSAIERRLKQFTNKLDLDFARALAWTFAQAVLSAIWDIEDGFEVDAANPSLRLANAIRPILTYKSRL